MTWRQVWARLTYLLFVQGIGSLDTYLTIEGLLFSVLIMLRGVDSAFLTMSQEMPLVKNGHVLIFSIFLVHALRLWAVLLDRLVARLWLSRICLAYWLYLATLYIWTLTAANEVGLFLAMGLANFWVGVRLGERKIVRDKDADSDPLPPAP